MIICPCYTDHSFLLTKYDYPFIVDPFNISNNDDFDEFIIRNIDDITATSNKNILMDYNFDNNMFTICLARNMLTYANSLELNEENIIKIYYPFLYKKDILNLSILNDNLLDFQEKTINEIGDKFTKQINNVSLFYDIFQHKTTTFDYLNKGIKNILITLGEKGCYFKNHEEEFVIPASSLTKPVIDTTGAGDAFNGGLAFGLSKEKPIKECLELANKVAGISTTKLGAGDGDPGILSRGPQVSHQRPVACPGYDTLSHPGGVHVPGWWGRPAPQ